jgi:hypothetical protein
MTSSSQRDRLAVLEDFAPWRTATRVASTAGRRAQRVVNPDRPVAWWAITGAAMLPVVLISAWMIAGALQPGPYNPVRQTVSTLAGQAGSHPWIVTSALIAVGPSYFAVACGLPAVRRAARIGLAVSGFAAIGIALSPEPVVGSTPQHVAFTGIGAASIAVWPALTAQRESPASILTTFPVAMTTTAIFLAMLGWFVAEAHGGSAVGFVERLDSSVQIVWPLAVALSVRGAQASERVGARETAT